MEGEPPQEEDFSQIPLPERSQHKNWKARLSAYNDIISKSAKTSSDTDPFFKPFVNDGALLKKWCLDANVVAQEKGIEAVLAIVTNSGEYSAKLRPDVVPALVDKALGSTRGGTKRKGCDLCLMFIEVENTGEGVLADVLVGLNSKTPKAIAGAVNCLKEMIDSFGVPTLGNVKPILKVLPKIFGHADKNVRAEGQGLVISLYTYLGSALMPALSDLKPVQVSDLQKEFDKMDAEGNGGGTGKPSRLTRKAQREREENEAAGLDEGPAEEPEAIDPLSFLEAVDVLALFPSGIMEQLASSKWKDRLEACVECNKVLSDPKNARIAESNVDAYGPLIQLLGTKCHKDANVNVVMEAAKVLEGLARGLGKSFGRFRGVCMLGCLERLKERKATVVEALGKALDAIFLTTTLQDVVEDVLTTLKSKNPQVKQGTLDFLHRSLRVTKDAPGKEQIKPMAETLVVLLGDSAEPVRTSSAECLGTLMKILGERAFNQYIEDVPELQMAKVKDAFSRAEIKYRPGGPKKSPAKPAGKPAATARPAPKKVTSGANELINDFEPPKRGPPARLLSSRPPSSPSAGGDDLASDMAPPKRAPPARLMAKKLPAPDEELSQTVEPPKRAPPARLLAKKERTADPVEDELLQDVAAPPKRAPPARLMRKAPIGKDDSEGSASPAPKALARPSASTTAKPANAAAPTKSTGGPKTGGAKTLASNPSDPIKYRFSPEEAAARSLESIPAKFHTALADGAWKVRLESATELVSWVSEENGAESADSEVMMRFLGKTPGWNEKNFQVSGKIFETIGLMASKSPTFGKPAAALGIPPLVEKLGDLKLKKPAGEALVTIAEKTSLAFVLAQSFETMSKQKAPKAQADALTWIKQQVIDFGIAGIQMREFISFIKAALGSPNAMVRSSATALLVQVKIGIGADISGFIEDLNAQLLATINKEFDKVAGQAPPDPIREQADLRDAVSGGGKGGKGGADPLDDLVPRQNLDKLVSQTSILNDSKSDAWKTRKEAYEAFNAILDIKSNQRLKPEMGEIGTVLKKATADTNLSVKMLALTIISKIATGMGQPFEKYNRLLVTAVALVCADQKATTRNAALGTLSAIADACGSLDSMYSHLAASLESPNPALRASVLGWIADRLKEHPPSPSADLGPLAQPVVLCLEDRNGDVRKGATALLPFVIASAGVDHVLDQTHNLKPASKATIVPLINKAAGSAESLSTAPASTAAPPPAATKAGSVASRTVKAPLARTAPGTPRAGASAVAPSKPSIAAPGRSIAMKALGSAPTTRPGSSLSDYRPGGIVKPRMPAPATRNIAGSVTSSAPASVTSGRTIPFTTRQLEPRVSRLKRDATRWSLEPGARADALEYLYQQLEPHASPDILTLLFSKDHRAEEDFMAALAVIAEFYDPETSSSFGLPEEEIQATQLANFDLALKYAAIRLLQNNTQLGQRSLEVISNVTEFLTNVGERLAEPEVRLFLPALVIKLGDAKFVSRLAPIFDGLDRLIPASLVVSLLHQYGLEDKAAGKTCKNESLLLLEKAYRKRGSVLRKDDRAFYEAIAKCIADQGTRNNALTVMALLQMQGESRTLQTVIAGMSTSAKDMLANRRATLTASKGPRMPADSGPSSPQPMSPRPKMPAPATTPTGKRLSREIPGQPASPGGSRPSSRGIPTLGLRMPAGSATPGRSLPTPSQVPRPMSVASNASSTAEKRASRPIALPTAEGGNGLAAGAGPTRISMQPLGRTPQVSEAAAAIQAVNTVDFVESAEALKALSILMEEDDGPFVPEAQGLIDALCHQLELTGPYPSDLLEPRNLRRIKHLMRSIHVAFGRASIVKRFKLDSLERLFRGVRSHYALLEVWSEKDQDENQQAADLRDYMSMVLSSTIATPSRPLVYQMLFDALVDLCKDMTPNQDPRVASEIGVILQCTYKRVRSIDSDLRHERISAGSLLLIIEDLLQVIPPVQWRRRPKYGLPHGDLPLRVVKTLLQRIIVYTKEINIGIYDLLQEQFGAEADMTTVYSYIFRISSADEAPQQQRQQSQPPAESTPQAVEPVAQQRSIAPERPTSLTAPSNKRSSVTDQVVVAAKAPAREVSEAERLVRRLTDTRDNELRLNELHAWMKVSPGNEAEGRAAISSILNPAAQTFVWRALDRRNVDSEPRSPVTTGAPPSPVRSPARELYSPPLGSTFNAPRQSLQPRPSSVALDRSAPVDDQIAHLKAVFARGSSVRNSMSPRTSASGTPTPPRPMSEMDPGVGIRAGGVTLAARPLSEISGMGLNSRPLGDIAPVPMKTQGQSPPDA